MWAPAVEAPERHGDVAQLLEGHRAGRLPGTTGPPRRAGPARSIEWNAASAGGGSCRRWPAGGDRARPASARGRRGAVRPQRPGPRVPSQAGRANGSGAVVGGAVGAVVSVVAVEAGRAAAPGRVGRPSAAAAGRGAQGEDGDAAANHRSRIAPTVPAHPPDDHLRDVPGAHPGASAERPSRDGVERHVPGGGRLPAAPHDRHVRPTDRSTPAMASPPPVTTSTRSRSSAMPAATSRSSGRSTASSTGRSPDHRGLARTGPQRRHRVQRHHAPPPQGRRRPRSPPPAPSTGPLCRRPGPGVDRHRPAPLQQVAQHPGHRALLLGLARAATAPGTGRRAASSTRTSAAHRSRRAVSPSPDDQPDALEPREPVHRGLPERRLAGDRVPHLGCVDRERVEAHQPPGRRRPPPTAAGRRRSFPGPPRRRAPPPAGRWAATTPACAVRSPGARQPDREHAVVARRPPQRRPEPVAGTEPHGDPGLLHRRRPEHDPIGVVGGATVWSTSSPDHSRTSSSRPSSSRPPPGPGSVSSPSPLSSRPGSPPRPGPEHQAPARQPVHAHRLPGQLVRPAPGHGRHHRPYPQPLGGRRHRRQRHPRVGDVGHRRPIQHVVPDEQPVPAGRPRLRPPRSATDPGLGQLAEDRQEQCGAGAAGHGGQRRGLGWVPRGDHSGQDLRPRQPPHGRPAGPA